MHQALQLFLKFIKLLLLYFIIFQLSRIYFVLYNTNLFEQNSLQVYFETAFHGFRLDLSASAYCIGGLLIIEVLRQIFKRKLIAVQKIYLIFTFTLILFITIADPELFQKWGNKFNSQVLVYITHPMEMALSAGATNWAKTALYTVVFLVFLVLFYKTILKVLNKKAEFHYLNTLCLLLYMGLDFVLIRGGLGLATISQSASIYSDQSVKNAAAINSFWNAFYFIFTNSDVIYKRHLYYLEDANADQYFKEQLSGPADTTKLFTTNCPNVMVVMLESITANASYYFSKNNKHTPYLDKIANENLSFMRCYASGDRTEKGLVTVLSGYPAQPSSSIIVFPDKMSKLPSISKSLRTQGYKNYYFYGGDAEFASMKAYLLVQQFDYIFDRVSFKPENLTSKWGAHDEHLYNLVLEKLSAEKGPFFTTIMSLSSHEPFDVPYHNKKIVNDEWYGFKNSIEYADVCLFNFLEKCKQQPWYANTVILLVSDHGHDIGLKDVHYFGPEKYHIPMVITGGALNQTYRGVKYEQVVSQTIIPQLILSQLGLPTADFDWQTGFEHNIGFAQYHYNNGFGRVNNTQHAMFDNDTRKCYDYRGPKADSLNFLNQAKAFQQVLIKDFLSK